MQHLSAVQLLERARVAGGRGTQIASLVGAGIGVTFRAKYNLRLCGFYKKIKTIALSMVCGKQELHRAMGTLHSALKVGVKVW